MASIDGKQYMIRCELCENPVKFHCNTCVACLCKECVGKHITENISVKHDIVEFKSRMSDPVLPTCTDHANQNCNLHCKQCEIPVCLKCLSTTHKMHDVEELSEMYSKIRNTIKEDTKELEEKIITEIERIREELQNKKLKLKEEYQPARTALAEQGDKWHREVDKVIQKYKSRLDQEEEKDTSVFDKHISDLNIVLSQARQKIQENKSILQSNITSGLTGYTSRNSEFRVVKPKIDINVPRFLPKYFEEDEVDHRFGILEYPMREKGKQISLNSTTKISALKPNLQLMNQSRVAMVVKSSDSFPVQCLSTPELYIGSHVYDFQTGKLLPSSLSMYVTRYYNNGNLGHRCPTDTVITKEGDIYVLFKNRLLKDIQPDSSLDKKYPGVEEYDRRTLLNPEDWTLLGLCCTKNNDLLVGLINKKLKQSKIVRVQILDKTIKQEIQYDNGKPIFNSNSLYMFIAKNKNGDICVSCWDMPAAVTVLTESGKVRFKYYGNLESETYGSFDPRGIVTDESCRILVADKLNNCIHIVDKDGQFLKYINNCHIESPASLSLDCLGRLAVGSETAEKVPIIKYTK